jgi:hypothetical protein
VSAIVAELYDALRKAGVDEELARSAARAVLAAEARADLTTKSDLAAGFAELRTEMAELKTDVIRWNVGAMAVMTGIFAAIVRLS